ncbi:MAG: type II toxin-antitoxin system VapC family toxin [Burkholderiales bacterium]|nr:type II toxin-antitoxin system VapC family toxin [Betaproteobacteria bacterium]
MIFVDTNILIDVLGDDSTYREWSQRQLDRALINHQLAINPLVYAEVSPVYASQERLDEVLAIMQVTVEPMSRRALFLAGKAHHAYRRRGGVQTRTFPDFLIGAQAVTAGAALITRDTSRYRTYFPNLTVISPAEKHE